MNLETSTIVNLILTMALIYALVNNAMLRQKLTDKSKKQTLDEHLQESLAEVKKSHAMEWQLEVAGRGYFRVVKDNKAFSIEDYHEMGDYTGPMKFKIDDATKLAKLLNLSHKGDNHIYHWRIYDQIKNQLDLTTGVYDREQFNLI